MNCFKRGQNTTLMKNLKIFWLVCLLCTGFMAVAQNSVSGTVTDEIGAPLPGATVLEKGTTNGTTTDFDGNYTIEVAENAVLEIAYLGYLTQEFPVDGQSTLDAQLDPDATQLEDVVVVGYGTQKKSDVTGSIGSVKSENFNKGVVANPGQLVTGQDFGGQRNLGQWRTGSIAEHRDPGAGQFPLGNHAAVRCWTVLLSITPLRALRRTR